MRRGTIVYVILFQVFIVLSILKTILNFRQVLMADPINVAIVLTVAMTNGRNLLTIK